MRATQHDRPILNLLGLTLALAATFLPAAAQSGSEAVVCVGSERRTLATNPIRRVYTEDMEIVYRIGADIGQRDQVERDLSSDLDSYPEVWCAWSDPGDDHAVIISYTGVIRQDLTVDREDPRFQAFSVGFGTDFDEAETQATTINQRFSSQSDGSGYEVLLRETWGVAEQVLTEVSPPESNLPDGRICTEVYSPDSCWMELADRPACYLWNPFPRENVTVTWSGGCSSGLAQGDGRVEWFQNGDLIQTWDAHFEEGRAEGPLTQRFASGVVQAEGVYVNGMPDGAWTYFLANGRGRQVGSYVNGQRHGAWTFFYSEGDVGPYVNGEQHGVWTGYDQSGNRLGTIRYEHGRRVGGSGNAVEARAAATLTPPHRSQRLGRLQGMCRDARDQRATKEPAWREAAWELWEQHNTAAWS